MVVRNQIEVLGNDWNRRYNIHGQYQGMLSTIGS